MKKIIVAVLLIVSACGVVTNDKSILDNSNCDLPCWNDIITGQTNENELLEILEKLPYIDQESIKNTNRPWDIFDNVIRFSIKQGWSLSQRSKLRGTVYITNGVVSALILCGETHTTIGRLVYEIGEPDFIISGNDIGGGRTVILIYPQKGVDYSYTTELDKLEIMPDTQVDCIHVFDPTLYEIMLDAKFFSSGYYNAEETMKVWYPWDGYGNLDEKYPPRQP